MKLFFTALAICSSLLPVLSQSMADKALAKLGEKVLNKSYSGKHLKEAAADSASTFLDGKEGKKDSEGLGGIYYCTHPVLVKNAGEKVVTVKKVRLEYVENDDKGKSLHIVYLKPAASFEDASSNKYIAPAAFYPNSTPRDTNIKVGKKAGNFFFDGSGSNNNLWEFFNVTGDKRDFSGHGIIEIEKGIFAVYKYLPRTEADIADGVKNNHCPIFYRADKAAAANALTQEEIYKKMLAANIKIRATNDDGSTGFQLPKPGAGKTDMFGKAHAAGTKILQDYINKKGGGSTDHKMLYLYTMTSNPYWKDIVEKRMVNGVQTEVKIGRYTEYYAVLQNNKPQPSKGIWQFNNKYSYIIVHVAEHMKGNAHSISEFTGEYFINSISQPYFLGAEENATIMRHKGQ